MAASHRSQALDLLLKVKLPVSHVRRCKSGRRLTSDPRTIPDLSPRICRPRCSGRTGRSCSLDGRRNRNKTLRKRLRCILTCVGGGRRKEKEEATRPPPLTPDPHGAVLPSRQDLALSLSHAQAVDVVAVSPENRLQTQRVKRDEGGATPALGPL